ncbi:Imm1 family immunity protein [Actinokineospora terrae]|uniref:Immunity protein Imm1 n=1 Tax=Actinokineospora terrae TaxID=155974 RepID=A0A1H9W0Z7_9PSEU|nr:Imm1 family immunity protein [Actinokineospora terrae]SES27347.1 Immunity protein Imm1 [Actinokineospora terrae]
MADPLRPVVTASLTTGVVHVTSGLPASTSLIDHILTLEHTDWETVLAIGDIEFHQTKDGPYPDHQMRLSVRPSLGFAALNYTDHTDPELVLAISHNPRQPPPDVDLIFNGATGAIFPHSAVIPIPDARAALHQWLCTRERPTCIQWRPFKTY